MSISFITCPACYQPFDKSQPPKGTMALILCESQHMVCDGCLKQLLRTSAMRPQGPRCPQCRRPLFNQKKPILSRQASRYNALVQAHHDQYSKCQQDLRTIKKLLEDSQKEVKRLEKVNSHLQKQISQARSQKRQVLRQQEKPIKRQQGRQKINSKSKQIRNVGPASEQNTSTIRSLKLDNMEITNLIISKKGRKRKLRRLIKEQQILPNEEQEYEALSAEINELERQYESNQACIENLQSDLDRSTSFGRDYI